MLTYKEYVENYGVEDQKTGAKRAGMPEDVFDILNTEEEYGNVLNNYYGVILIHDILLHITEALIKKSSGVDHDLTGYKKLGKKFKKIIEKNDVSELSDKFYDMVPTSDQREFFETKGNSGMVNRIASILGRHEPFYEAVSTSVGAILYDFLKKEKALVLKSLYGGNGSTKSINTEGAYYKVVSTLYALWTSRIRMYENYANQLKFVNGSLGYGRKG